MDHIDSYKLFEEKLADIFVYLYKFMDTTDIGKDLSALTTWTIKSNGTIHFKGDGIPLSNTVIRKIPDGWESYSTSNGKHISNDIRSTLEECGLYLWAKIVSKNIPAIIIPKNYSVDFILKNIKPGLGLRMPEILKIVRELKPPIKLGGDQKKIDEYLTELTSLARNYNYGYICSLDDGIVTIREEQDNSQKRKNIPGSIIEKGNSNDTVMVQCMKMWHSFIVKKIPRYFLEGDRKSGLDLGNEIIASAYKRYSKILADGIKSNKITISTGQEELLSLLFQRKIPDLPGINLKHFSYMGNYPGPIVTPAVDEALKKISLAKDIITIFMQDPDYNYNYYFNISFVPNFITPDFVVGFIYKSSDYVTPIDKDFQTAINDASKSYITDLIGLIRRFLAESNNTNGINYVAIFDSIFNEDPGNTSITGGYLAKHISEGSIDRFGIILKLPDGLKKSIISKLQKEYGYTQEDINSYTDAKKYGLY